MNEASQNEEKETTHKQALKKGLMNDRDRFFFISLPVFLIRFTAFLLLQRVYRNSSKYFFRVLFAFMLCLWFVVIPNNEEEEEDEKGKKKQLSVGFECFQHQFEYWPMKRLWNSNLKIIFQMILSLRFSVAIDYVIWTRVFDYHSNIYHLILLRNHFFVYLSLHWNGESSCAV